MAEVVKWEYSARKVEGDVLPAFRDWGVEGWEVITAMQTQHGVAWLIKRPLQAIIPPSAEEVRTLSLVRDS